MQLRTAYSMSVMGLKHIRSLCSDEMYLRTGLDSTKPVSIYVCVNERCNAKCKACDSWRMKQYAPELSIEEWQRVLMDLKRWIGQYSVSFSGGEPFLKRGFTDLLLFCSANGIKGGATTNGSCFTPTMAAKTVTSRPFNINISVDAPTAEVHDRLRGYPGLFDKLSTGIQRLRKEQAAQRVEFPIIIKPTISSANVHVLADIVGWASDIGATSVNFQPLDLWTPETRTELWIHPPELPALSRAIDSLLDLKAKGAPIMNSPETLALSVAHFRGDRAPQELRPCRVGLHSLFIRSNGAVHSCFLHGAVGNVKESNVEALWRSPSGRASRRQTVACERLCLNACVSQKSLMDKIGMAVQLLRNRRSAPDGIRATKVHGVAAD